MRKTTLLASVASLLLVACEGSYGNEDWTPDTDPDTDADSDTDPDTDPDTDTDTDTDTDPPDPKLCHAYDPVEAPGLTRNYRVNYRGEAGTETQTVGGEGLLPDGSLAYYVTNTLEAGPESWTGQVYHGCTPDRSIQIMGWNMTLKTEVALGDFGTNPIEIGPVEGLHTPAKRYLPPVSAMGNSGNKWNGDYDVQVTNAETNTEFTTKGEFQEIGFQKTTVPAGEFDVYAMSYRYTQDRSGISAFSLPPELQVFEDLLPDFDIFAALGSFSEDIDAYAEYHYAKDVGLVYELTVDANSGDIIMEKELTSFTPGR